MDGTKKGPCHLAPEHCWHETRCIVRHTVAIAVYEERCCHCGFYHTTEHAVTPHGPFR